MMCDCDKERITQVNDLAEAAMHDAQMADVGVTAAYDEIEALKRECARLEIAFRMYLHHAHEADVHARNRALAILNES